MKQALMASVLALCAVVSAETAEPSWYWRLDTTEETLTNISSDGTLTNWVLKVSELDHDNKTLALGTGSGIGNAYTYTQQEYADGSVTNFIVGSGKMDLSTQILDENDVAWKATTIAAGKVFSAPAAVPHALREFVFPKTIKEIRGDAFNPRGWGQGILTSITMECPELEIIPAHCFYSNTKVTYLLVKCPKVKTIGQNAFRELYDLSRSNVDEWDLSGVEKLSGSDTNGAFSYVKVAGTLRLPNVRRIESGAFYTATINLELGFNRTLEYVGYNAFGSRNTTDYMPSSIVFCGAADGWTMSAGAIRLDGSQNGGPRLKQITFLGYLPKRLEDGKTWFTTLDNVELKTCFYLNEEFADCKAILDTATPATDAEIHTFTNANKTARAPSGIVDASVFNTAHRQFVGSVDLSRYLTPMFSCGAYDARYGDSVECVGEVAFGSFVTLKPNIKEGNAFAEWMGAPEGAVVDPVTHEITFKIGYAPLDVRLRTSHPWRFLRANTAENGTTTNRITDGRWLLNVWIVSAGERRLGLGRNAYAAGSAYTGIGNGILDLNGPIYDADGTTVWRITHHGDRCLGAGGSMTNVVTELFLSTNIVSAGSDLCFIAQSTEPKMKKLVVDLPLATALGHGLDCGQTALEELELNIPKVKKIGGYAFCGRPNLKVDAGTWRLDSLETLYYGGSFYDIPGLTGTLRLPSITLITNGVYNFTGLDAIELGRAWTNKSTRFRKTLQLHTGRTLSGCTKLKTLVFGPYAGIEFQGSDEMFKRTSALKEVVFLGRPISKESIDIVLRGVTMPADGAIQTAIYVSAYLDWESADYVTPIVDGDPEKPYADAFEATLGENERLMGIYNAANGERKAWIVHRPSVCDPKGTVLLFR